MVPPEKFLTHSLSAHPHGPSVTRILAAALEAVEPGTALRRHVQRVGDALRVGEQTCHLAEVDNIHLAAFGKASLAMSAALADILGDRLTSGVVVTKHVDRSLPGILDVMEGGHPLPDARSLAAGRKIVGLLGQLGERDLLFCLVSGGGSALAAAPRRGVTLADLQTLTACLLSCGARIDEINFLRRRLDLLKGGGLARLAQPGRVISLILSDVVGDALEAIASGPTAPEPARLQDAAGILEKYGLRAKIPPSVIEVLKTAPQGLPPGDAVFTKVQNVIVGSNLLAAQAALRQAEAEGFHPRLLRNDLQGEARVAGRELAQVLRRACPQMGPGASPSCLVAGGETTVTLRADGRGGRNQELALAAVPVLAGAPGALLVTLATDGEDGPTDAAGAVVIGDTLRRALDLGLDPQKYLENHDSYMFFEPLDDLLKPGPTGTNVNDLVVMFLGAPVYCP
ncbi:MAG: DUF4147 domain-containing protein [Chloroflexi bacterium]|nr:DUF4147 domain-containing protein [Chloroflexota bacterium]